MLAQCIRPQYGDEGARWEPRGQVRWPECSAASDDGWGPWSGFVGLNLGRGLTSEREDSSKTESFSTAGLWATALPGSSPGR